jgi:hypothetical protein
MMERFAVVVQQQPNVHDLGNRYLAVDRWMFPVLVSLVLYTIHVSQTLANVQHVGA